MLNKHFREFIRLLEKQGVEFLIVGGYAVGFHGFPRYTRKVLPGQKIKLTLKNYGGSPLRFERDEERDET